MFPADHRKTLYNDQKTECPIANQTIIERIFIIIFPKISLWKYHPEIKKCSSLPFGMFDKKTIQLKVGKNLLGKDQF